MEEIKNLEPRTLWSQFGNICAIPHPSKHETALLNYIIKFAETHSLAWRQDLTGNIIVSKPASAGKQQSPAVVLQAHIDMVPQKNSDKVFNFETDPIEPYVDGEWVKAKGTTLGADNGIGVAAMLAILGSSELTHPALECLFTVEEETGLTGANGLSNDLINGKLLINLDSEDEGELYVGCAGAVNNTVKMEYKQKSTPTAMVGYEVALLGLKGGHSGIQIIMQRANANKLMTRFLREQSVETDVRLSSFDGGTLRNAIPREARAIVAVSVENSAAFEAAAAEFQKQIVFENEAQEDSINFAVTKTKAPSKILSRKSQTKIIDALTVTPNGVFRMSDAMPGLVETSTNMARVGIANGQLEVLFMTRCMVNYGKRELNAMIRGAWELAGAEVTQEGNYDGWAPNMSSVLLKTMGEAYMEMFGTMPAIKAIHAGLECGIIGAKYQDMDMISIGPTMQYPHSPDERVNIATVEKFYNFLLFTLSKI